MTIQRQTGCSVGELVKLLEVGFIRSCGGGRLGCGRGTPVGVIVNDLGAFFIDEQNTEAESALVNLLTSEQGAARFAAYCYLKLGANQASMETLRKLAEFEADPANAELIEEANRRLAAEA